MASAVNDNTGEANLVAPVAEDIAAHRFDRLGPRDRTAREINAQPWEPLPGMKKARCLECQFYYATPIAKPQHICPDCRDRTRRLNQEEARREKLRLWQMRERDPAA